jgi:hypothetical protein
VKDFTWAFSRSPTADFSLQTPISLTVEGVDMSWLRWPWQTYGALYVLFVKLYAWRKLPSISDRHLAATAVSAVKMVCLWCFLDWYQVSTGWHMKTYNSAYYIVAIAIALFDYWFFDKLGFGQFFELQFNEFSPRKRVLIGGAAIACVALLVPFVVYTRNVYVQALHIPAS